VISGYETFLRGEFARTVQPTLILQIGAMPVSAALLDYLGSAKDARRVLLSESGRWSDGFHLLERVISGDHHGLLRALQSASVVKRIVDPAWLEVWMAADQTAWDALDALRGRESVEGAVAADLVDLLPEGTVLFAANSGPVRHLDQFIRGQQKDIIVYANRGASGIDGSLATALGVASASGRPAALLTGDLALYHDLNSLHLIQRLGIDLHVVVINNDGGGIFHRLPIADQGAPFRELFQTPHGLSFEHAAALFNLGYGRAEDAGDFREVFSAVLKTAHPHLVEIFSDPAQFEKQRRELNQTVIEQLAPIHAL
jgi:2-succinyl-5-enolpyruvyl-6-hydroxy-3-cyclohexene-1-carboxylate synthase